MELTEEVGSNWEWGGWVEGLAGAGEEGKGWSRTTYSPGIELDDCFLSLIDDDDEDVEGVLLGRDDFLSSTFI